MPETPQDPKRINASPTKEFFIYMLTRDIPLTRAILDLVDNSVDGARRMQANGDFNGLWVRVELDRNHLKIADNCGGIPVDIARNYAFRFGRPKDAPLTPGSVGQFGVGMKRTFFKLGRHFTVYSTTSSSRFDMDIDVEQWKAMGEPEKADEWHFEFRNVEENLTNVSPEEIGTRIEINQLYDTVAENFALDNFLTRLKQEMSLAHALSMDRGLAITVNTIPLRHEPQLLFVSDKLKPAYVEKTYPRAVLDGQPGPPVKVKLFAGVAERSLHEGGWYVFCNGRLVIRADQTATTIWGQAHGMRQYHPDFAYFRGYAYFDSDNAALLPWTTTKTGVDVDSPVYKNVQQEMIEISKPVLTFLSNLAKERAAFESGDSTDGTLDQAIQSAEAKRTDALTVTPTFVAPQPSPMPPGPRMQKIQYSKPLVEVEKAKQLLKVQTFIAVGEKTFEYFMKYEGEE
ncbi:MAG: ATP-binding protein [Nitrospirota bacterium]